jgi:hypothetical protein
MTSEENLSIARRLRAAGIDIPIDEDESDVEQFSRRGLLIRTLLEIAGNSAVDLGKYGTFYQLYLRITTNLKGIFAPTQFGLGLSWDDPICRLLEDPHTSQYRVPGAGSFRYERNEVLNHRADVRYTLQRGQSMQGYLLWIGGPMPDYVQHGTTVPTMFSVVDQFDRRFQEAIPLWADRSERLLGNKAHKKIPRRRLFDVRDVQRDNDRVQELVGNKPALFGAAR